MVKKIILCASMVFNMAYSSAQLDTTLCTRRLERMSKKLLGSQVTEEELLMAIDQSISPCYGENTSSYLLKGLLELNRTSGINYNLAHTYFNRASNLGDAKAKTHLAFFYKNGLGTPIDLKKAQAYLEEASSLEDETASYALGYFYFKGLNPDQQDYKAARVLFEKSNNAMAKHWLAVCYLFGLGGDQNTHKAIELLSSNTTMNSQTLLKNIPSKLNNFGALKEVKFAIDGSLPMAIQEWPKHKLQGGLFELDWSSKKVISEHLFAMALDKEKNSVVIQIGDKEMQSSINVKGNKIIPDELSFRLPALIQDNPEIEEYTYVIKDIEVFKNREANRYSAKVATWIKELNEPGPPIYLNLMSQKLIEDRIKSSIVIYPNPFTNSFNIGFTLAKPSEVAIEIYDLQGFDKIKIDKRPFTTGENSIEVDATTLLEGMYLSNILIDGVAHIKQVLKINQTK